MDSNRRFRATTSFVLRPRRTSPVAMILCVGNSDQAVKQSWINRERYASEISAGQGMAKLNLAPHMRKMMANATNPAAMYTTAAVLERVADRPQSVESRCGAVAVGRT
jgi:hypothetical protein